MTTTQFLATPDARPAHDSLPSCTNNIAAAYYNVPNRAYHTWQHVLHVHACANRLLAHLLDQPNQLSEGEAKACVLAITWHDVFQGPNHEAASAAKLYHENPDITAALAARLIVDGTTHFAPPETALFFKALGIPAPSSDHLKLLTNIIHDADLMILGEEAMRYDEYARAIVVEALAFGLNLADYRKRRIQFLHWVKSAVTEMTLFTTAPAQQLNPTVLENIERELGRLG
jgi:predicted metal-dependent HD superfamily phosphohydrolase